MKPLLEHPTLILAVRLVVGSIFVFSSIEKASDPYAFALLIENYKILPFSINLFIATLLPWTELVCGMALIFGISFRGASAILGSMTTLFTLAVISGILRDLDITCGCFTLDPEASRIGWQKVAENAGIVFLSIFLVFTKRDGLRIQTLSADADAAR